MTPSSFATDDIGLDYFLGERVFIPRPLQSTLMHNYVNAEGKIYQTTLIGRVAKVHMLEVRSSNFSKTVFPRL